MSGITPLLDTLLHQVLGKRVDLPTQRELNEPVRPTDPSRAPRAVHSDSRLDSRQPTVQGLTGAVAREGGRLPGPALPTGDAPASTHTHFSQAARTIADILVKFPAPPSTLRPAAPLVAPSQPAAVPAGQLATQLQSSINHSGLFYESHLGRWYRGELPRQALDAQPQMQLTQGQRAPQAAPATLSPSAGGGAMQWPAAPLSPRGALVFSGPFVPLGSPAASVALGMMTTAQPGAGGAANTLGAGGYIPLSSQPSFAAPGASASAPVASTAPPALPAQVAAQAMEGAEPVASRAAGQLAESTNELLQGLIRHQLEVLVTPILRWEGDVWSGIFMALMIQLPVERERSPPGEGGGAHEEEEPAWHSTLSLTLPALGEIHVDLRLKGERVALTLESVSRDVVQRLEEGKERLRDRLTARGFQEVALLARLRVEEGDHHE
ncbi:flagellar hook-length control protein FliK [Franzmannia qiaohouensis]|uniref:Flagellar hook-length control protein FliK n=1 Tax=Franzmannia qiaohouensis TaxID=1329370 RepID=A0ABU1HGQ4_9GAMM|nr:flagellar hook-length control protein FliK [Halomonas qiaohouensis]MDR5905775.1 flagellar hook-length control protein FliK [Halomonas qiaohouensis]